MWPVLRTDQILRLHQDRLQPSATSTISNQESRTMRSAETQTELLECSSSSEEEEPGEQGASSEDAGSVIEDDEGYLQTVERPLDSDHKEDDDIDDDDDEDSLGEESKLKNLKRLHCGNLFNFNKLELLNERCSGAVSGPQKQQISDSSRNLCEHEVHVAIDDDLSSAVAAGEGKRTMTMMTTAVLGDDSGSSSVIFIQESPEVIL